MNVLIVDNSRMLRERLRTEISPIKGIRSMREAASAPEARALMTERLPDVLILDILMPEGNGIDLLRDIKKRRSCPVVIVLTNYPYPQCRKICMDLGAEYFFDKSTEYEKVSETLVGLIRKRKKGKGD